MRVKGGPYAPGSASRGERAGGGALPSPEREGTRKRFLQREGKGTRKRFPLREKKMKIAAGRVKRLTFAAPMCKIINN